MISNGVYLIRNLPKIRDGTHIINLDEYKLIGTHWIALFVNGDNVTYFESFGIEHIPEEIKKFISNKNVKTNICRIQANHSITCGYFCVAFINFMLKR